jgi:hypothetical protein
MSITHRINAVLERERTLTGDILVENGWRKTKDLNFVTEYEKDVKGHPCIVSIYPSGDGATRTNIFWQESESVKIDVWKSSFSLADANAIFSVYNLPHILPSCQ